MSGGIAFQFRKASAPKWRAGRSWLNNGASCIAIAAWLWLSTALYGCFNDCDPGSHRCNGARLEICQSPCSDVGCTARWSPDATCTSCVDPPHGEPFCALSSTPEPRCKDTPAFCDGATAVYCESGYRRSLTDCGDKFCVAPTLHAPLALNDRAALCAMAKDPDSRCGTTQGYNQVCTAQSLLDCESGFLLQVFDCPTGMDCVQEDGAVSFCH